MSQRLAPKYLWKASLFWTEIFLLVFVNSLWEFWKLLFQWKPNFFNKQLGELPHLQYPWSVVRSLRFFCCLSDPKLNLELTPVTLHLYTEWMALLLNKTRWICCSNKNGWLCCFDVEVKQLDLKLKLVHKVQDGNRLLGPNKRFLGGVGQMIKCQNNFQQVSLART
jgi:hypothetical protein